jgi:hypothetical protein
MLERRRGCAEQAPAIREPIMRNFLAAMAVMSVTLYAVAAPARPLVGLGAAYPVACAAGYHLDAGGNCQPNAEQANRYCPKGTVFHPTFDGWECDPPPPEAY